MYVPTGNSWKEKINKAIKDGQRIEIVIGLSAGKDSSAVALLFNQVFPDFNKDNIHYVFADTGSELPETYEYLNALSKSLGKEVIHLISRVGTLEQIIDKYGGYLPNASARYCTRMAKIVPFRDYMDDLAKKSDVVFNLVGIRADEPQRTGYAPCGQYAHKVHTELPLKDEGMDIHAVFSLVESKVGLPKYYEWRTRSGCYFCFYQRRIEWVNLLEKHPELFQKAKTFEKIDPKTGKRFTWNKNLSLDELEAKANEIKARYAKKLGKKLNAGESLSFTDASIFEALMQELEPEQAESCSTCR